MSRVRFQGGLGVCANAHYKTLFCALTNPTLIARASNLRQLIRRLGGEVRTDGLQIHFCVNALPVALAQEVLSKS